MTDWLSYDGSDRPQQLVGRWDPDARLFIATGWTYGPAGPATAEILPGLRFSFDFAEPQQISEVVVEAPLDGDPTGIDGDVRRALGDVLGARPAERLLATASSADARPARLGAVAASRFGSPSGLGRFALANEIANSFELSPVQRAAAAIETAHIAAMSTVYRLVLAGRREQTIDEATAVLRELSRNDFIVDGYAADELNAMISDLVSRHEAVQRWPRFRAHVAPAAAELRELSSSLPAPMAAAAPDMPSVAELSFRTPTEVVVRAPHATESTWARVYRSADNMLLGLAPFRRVDGRSRALVVIPPGLGETDVWFDLTEDPATSPSFAAQQMRRAIEVGREACRYERIGDTFNASDRWRECADTWARIGDKTRSEQALARSRQSFRTDPVRRGTAPRGEPPRPLASDFV